MAPSKTSWDDEDSDSSTSSSPAAPAIAVRRGKFDDEEDEVVDSWDAAEDSEEEREKAKKAAEAKAKADAAAKANTKSRSQRIEELRNERLRQKAETLDLEDSEDEDEASRRQRLRAAEKEGDFAAAEDLFGGVGGVPDSRSKATKAVTVQAGDAPEDKIDLAKMQIFNPSTALQFNNMREAVAPLFNQNGKKPHYELFYKEFLKQTVRDLNSEQVKKLASQLTTISNEKMREEKAAEKGGKKTKAAKTKTSLNANRNLASTADTMAYDDDGLDDGDFM